MAKKFFTGWAIWQKLVFILGCAIIVTVLVGCAKLAYTHNKLRKLGSEAANEKSESTIQRHMSQRSWRNRAPEVPFGIRAIESGVETDGVWISRGNTPEPSPSNETSKSFVCEHVQPKDGDIDLEKQYRAQDRRCSCSSSIVGTARPASSCERAVPAGTSSSRPASQDSSPDAATIAKPPKHKQHPPLAYAKYSGNSSLRPAPAVTTIDAAIHQPSDPMQHHDEHHVVDSLGEHGSAYSNSNSNQTEPIASAAPGLPHNPTRERQQSTDLDLMHSHRMSQAAETGQLTPRGKRPGYSGERPSVGGKRQSSVDPTTFDYSGRRRTRSSSPASTKFSSPLYPPGYPSIDSLPPEIRRSSLPDVTPFTTFCQTAPPSPRADGNRPSSIGSNRSHMFAMQMVGDSLVDYMSVLATPTTTTPPRPRVPPIQKPHECEAPEIRPSFEKLASPVIRGHGSGFEILRSGTLDEETEHEKQQQSRSGPPISLQNGSSRPRASSADSHRRKLQKRRRPSQES